MGARRRGFLRGPGPLRLDGIRAADGEAIRRVIAARALGRVHAVADLSLGSWRSHHVATELREQLGIAQPLAARASASSVADTIGELIDAEGRGDGATLAAFDAAVEILDRVARETDAAPLVLVVAPRFALAWEREDALCVRFLAEALREVGGRVALVAAAGETPALPTDWVVEWTDPLVQCPAPPSAGLLGMIPGVVPRSLAPSLASDRADGLAALWLLGDDFLLVPPSWRRPPTLVSRLDYDRLGAAAPKVDWVQAYAQYHGNNRYVDRWFLLTTAQSHFAAGSHGVALRLAERAMACTPTTIERSVMQSIVQGMRIATRRFADAAAEPDAPQSLPPALRTFLLEIKGWALTMRDDPTLAERYLEEARALTTTPASADRDQLYLLNISALNRLKLGDLAGALDLERRIERCRAESPVVDWQLAYVNTINLARLQRRAGDWENADAYYRQAFAIAAGAATESDCVHASVSHARLRDEHRPAEAFAHWLRAALYWVAARVPEAMSQRVTVAIIGRTPSPHETVPESVSETLTTRLMSSATAAGLARLVEAMGAMSAAASDDAPVPQFVRGSELEADAMDSCRCVALLVAGVGVVASSRPQPCRFEGPQHRRLRAVLSALLRSACPDAEWSGTGTVIVDDRFGRGIPSTVDELLEVCVRLAVPRMIVDGRAMDVAESTRTRLAVRSRVRLAAAVDTVRWDEPPATVHFRRYLPPQRLTEREAGVIAKLADDPELARLAQETGGSVDDLLPLVRSLEQRRVVEVEVPGVERDPLGGARRAERWCDQPS